MIGNVTNFLSEEEGDVGFTCLDINVVPFELFDAFCNELVVVNEWPQVSVKIMGRGS